MRQLYNKLLKYATLLFVVALLASCRGVTDNHAEPKTNFWCKFYGTCGQKNESGQCALWGNCRNDSNSAQCSLWGNCRSDKNPQCDIWGNCD